MSDPAILNSAADIDLSRHGVIEAHAGAGKTYAIVQLVLRILREPAPWGKPALVHLRDILLVTFTEKAAGELTARIRQGIEECIAQHSLCDPLRRHLEDCLHHLHEAFIGTIHSVCLRLLQTWPFETGAHFTVAMVDDSDGLEDALRQSMRTDWQEEAAAIPWALEQLAARGVALTAAHRAQVIGLARELLDAANATLDRRAIGGLTLPLLRNLLQTGAPAYPACAAWNGFRRLLEGCIETMQAMVADPQGLLSDDILAELRRRIDAWTPQLTGDVLPEAFAALKTFGGRRPMNTAKTKKHPLFSRLQGYHDQIPCHLFLQILKGESILPTLLSDAAEALRNRWMRTKQESGMISYHDMLELMHRAVHANPALCDSLRRRLRFGIIDEFQDTSILQWQIFKRIFLDAPQPGPRMIIVGDPKQSIYSFQGADVQSYFAAKAEIMRRDGRVYCLVENFRSLPCIIDKVNSVLAAGDGGPNWFAFEDAAPLQSAIAYPSQGEGGALARPPQRANALAHTLDVAPVQVMALTGNAGRRRAVMAAWTSLVIRSLRGAKLSIPRGREWEDIVLDYQHCAVLVESHRLATPFLDQFSADGIPFVKYKMEGVFQSEMARDLHALLRAILHSYGDAAARMACLLTRFFNRHPANLDPHGSLEPCANLVACENGGSCLAHALEEWTRLAQQRRWALLFARIQERTGIRERLIRLAGGERHLADLRQIIDYCIEKLYRSNFSLPQLVEHLARLLAGEESAGRDQNLHALATGRSAVRVLTMHAAKGLEFPVVFVVTSGSERRTGGMVCWIAADGKRHVAPVLSNFAAAVSGMFGEGETVTIRSWGVRDRGLDIYEERHSIAGAQAMQERRRLLYVAMTRAQALLFLPAHLDSIAIGEGGIPDWKACSLPSKPDADLTPRLLHLVAKNAIEPFSEQRWRNRTAASTANLLHHLDPQWTPPVEAQRAWDQTIERIRSLRLFERLCRQTSYTELTRKTAQERTLDRSEGDDGDVVERITVRGEPLPPAHLPRGSATGDALHQALEALIGMERIDAQAVDAEWIRPFLDSAGILRDLDGEAHERAVCCAASLIRRAVTEPHPLPGGGSVVIADVPKPCRIAEMEFHLGVEPDWVHGYLDLVLRTQHPRAPRHPWRYYVLDWKSDSLREFTAESIAACVRDRHYDLQAKIYCHALDRYLRGILGEAYDPRENLGGAVYVLLRSFEVADPATVHAWVRDADLQADAAFVRACLGRPALDRVMPG